MYKSIIFKSKEQESAYYLEWAYVTGRAATLILLAIGSLIVTYMIGGFVGEVMFPDSMVLIFLVKNAFVITGFIAVDFGLSNALSSASRAGKTKKSTWAYAITSLCITISLSLVSNSFVSTEMTGKSNLGDYNRQVEKAMVRDSTLKVAAFNLVKASGKEQKNLIADARKEGKNLIQLAINNPDVSQNWKNDYQKHKNVPNGWFWKCTKCPKKYKVYRNSILSAKKEAANILVEAKGHKQSIENTVAPTLSYSMSNDSTLRQVNRNVLAMESERKERKNMINKILLFLTVGCGILALFITIELKSHRSEKHGQQITENHVMPIMMTIQMVKRLVNYVLNVFYSIAVLGETFTDAIRLNKTFVLDFQTVIQTDNGSDHATVVTDETAKRLEAKRLEDSFKNKRLAGQNSNFQTDSQTVKTETDKRLEKECTFCKTDISNKRSDAKFCSKDCRMKHHNFKI